MDLNHGQQRLGFITASIARTVMRGGQDAWETLSKRMWADDGTEFGLSPRGPRAFGHQQEPFGVAKFWDRHPALEPVDNVMYAFLTRAIPWKGEAILVGCSPDRIFASFPKPDHIVGIQVKSPTDLAKLISYNADCCRGNVPDEHRDQVQHELLVSGFKEWYFVAHFEEHYTEVMVKPDPVWREQYMPRLGAFWKFHNDNIVPERRKLGSVSDIGSI